MEDSGKMISAVLFGAAIGALAGVLLAPDKGSSTRKKIVEGTKDWTSNLKDTAIRLKEKVQSFGESAEDELRKSVNNYKEEGEKIMAGSSANR